MIIFASTIRRIMRYFKTQNNRYVFLVALIIGCLTGNPSARAQVWGCDCFGECSCCMTSADTVAQTPRRHLIAVRTNLLHDFFYMPNFGWAFSPNLQLEYYPKDGHYTYNIGLTWGTNRRWSSQEFFQVRDLQLEVRRYFKGGGEFMGAYLGAYLNGNKYGIGLDRNKGWQGEGGGAGLSIGYTVPLNKRKNLRMEFMAAVGFYMTYYDKYVWGDPRNGDTSNDWYYYDTTLNKDQYKERNNKFTWFGPTNVGIQVTYDIIYRKRKSSQKGGRL